MNDNQTRDLIAGLIIATLCIGILCKVPLPDMFKDIVLMVIGFFFGSRGSQSQEKPANEVKQ